jgi:hypothetical protein
METIKTKSGVIVKGTYGSAYDAGSDTVKEARVSSGKRGRPAAVAPVAFITNPMNDLFGRVSNVVSPTFEGGRVITGALSIHGDKDEE